MLLPQRSGILGARPRHRATEDLSSCDHTTRAGESEGERITSPERKNTETTAFLFQFEKRNLAGFGTSRERAEIAHTVLRILACGVCGRCATVTTECRLSKSEDFRATMLQMPCCSSLNEWPAQMHHHSYLLHDGTRLRMQHAHELRRALHFRILSCDHTCARGEVR